MVDRGEHRIGDAERQQAIDVLRAHTGAGRLTLDEFSDLAGEVYAAMTYGELDAVARNLPPGLVPSETAPSPTAGLSGALAGTRGGPDGATAVSSPASSGRARRRFVAIMGGSRARGRWRAAPKITAFAFWGGVDVDLRRAEIEGGVVDITAWAVMGGVTVTVPEGIRVEVDGMVLMGGASDLTRTAEVRPGAPLVRVHARGLWGAVAARTRRTREQRQADRTSSRSGGTAAADEVPRRPSDPLELPRRVLDDLATRLPQMPDPAHMPYARSDRTRRDRSRRDGQHDGRMPPPAAPDPRPDGAADPTSPATGTGTVRADGAVPSSAPSGTLTMMVTDIAESTALAERLGDRRWIDVLADHNALVRAAVARHDGTEVKAQGDGFLVVFASARRAILAAVDVQRALARYRAEHADTPVAVRVGLHTGEIVDVDGDVFGQNVVAAVRIADQAVPGEIVVSGLTRDLTASGGDLSFGPGREVTLKGLSAPWRVHRVDWAAEPA
jgi:class 3 adenylate cyclase